MRRLIQVLVNPIRQSRGDWEYLLLRRVLERDAFRQDVTGVPFEGECWPNNKDALKYCREFLTGRSLHDSS